MSLILFLKTSLILFLCVQSHQLGERGLFLCPDGDKLVPPNWWDRIHTHQLYPIQNIRKNISDSILKNISYSILMHAASSVWWDRAFVLPWRWQTCATHPERPSNIFLRPFPPNVAIWKFKGTSFIRERRTFKLHSCHRTRNFKLPVRNVWWEGS